MRIELLFDIIRHVGYKNIRIELLRMLLNLSRAKYVLDGFKFENGFDERIYSLFEEEYAGGPCW